MIEVKKLEEFNNCNCCGKYNMQPSFHKMKDEKITNDNIYEYIIYYGVGGQAIRLCDKCAKEMICKLNKQIDK